MREDETYCAFCEEIVNVKFIKFFKDTGKLICTDCYDKLVQCSHCHELFFEKDLIEFNELLYCDSCCVDEIGLAYCKVCGKYYVVVDDDDKQLMCYDCRKDLEHL